jgi:hypothetical protein
MTSETQPPGGTLTHPESTFRAYRRSEENECRSLGRMLMLGCWAIKNHGALLL